jgi:hypothetical protein
MNIIGSDSNMRYSGFVDNFDKYGHAHFFASIW